MYLYVSLGVDMRHLCGWMSRAVDPLTVSRATVHSLSLIKAKP